MNADFHYEMNTELIELNYLRHDNDYKVSGNMNYILLSYAEHFGLFYFSTKLTHVLLHHSTLSPVLVDCIHC